MVNITLIAAVSLNGVIGNDNTIPWQNKEDMMHFKETTMGNVVIMGRKTFESIGSKPLRGRVNIVVSSTLRPDPMYFCMTLEDALEATRNNRNKETFVIGGGEIYKQTIGLANKLIISHIHKPIEGDVKFPEIDLNVWGVGKIDHRLSGDTPFTIVHYVRK